MGIKGIPRFLSQTHPLPRFLSMVFRYTFNRKSALERYAASDEAPELSSHESKLLQSTMAGSWKTVLMKRVVRKMLRVRTARSRSARLAERSRKIRNALAPIPSKVVTPSASQDTSMEGRRLKWSRPIDSDDENESDDEPLAIKLQRRRICEFSGARSDVESDEESDEGAEASDDGSDEGSGSQGSPDGEEEHEESSEDENSESEDDSEDEVIFMGTSTAVRSKATTALRQSLVFEFFSRT
jgi:hypothetical protein